MLELPSCQWSHVQPISVMSDQNGILVDLTYVLPTRNINLQPCQQCVLKLLKHPHPPLLKTVYSFSAHLIVADLLLLSLSFLKNKDGLGFAEVFLECSTELALTRNGQRSTAVSADTIETMATKTESPEPDKFPWEQNNLKLDTTTSLETGSLYVELLRFKFELPWTFP